MCIKPIKWLCTSMLLGLCLFLLPTQEVSAQIYTDSLTFKIDSAKIEGEFLTYSVMFWRTNENWRGGDAVISSIQDTMLGNTDLYFWIENVVFDTKTAPQIERHHPKVDVPSSGPWASPGTNLLDITARYYARRFAISLKNKTTGLNNGMGVVEIPYMQPTELCQIKLRMSNPAQNPGLYWDTLATGGQSTIGEPLILTYEGDIKMNPDKDIILVDHTAKEYVCEGGEAKIWAKGHSAGDQLKIAWYMSDKSDCIEQYKAGNGVKFYSDITGNVVSGQVHVVDVANSAKWGNLSYHITCANDGLERVDTLHIMNVPLSMDSVYFQCELSDPSTGSAPRTSLVEKTQILIRERIQGWFATSSPSKRADYLTTNIGAHDRTDTVMKCPSTGAIVSFYFFGPKCNTDKEVIGNKMLVNYVWRDALGNAGEDNAEVNTWQVVTGQNAPNGKCLYRGTVVTDKSITDKLVWIQSIATEKGCMNGGPYAPYDTVYIQDIPQDETLIAVLTDTTLSAGESFKLNAAFSDYELKQPALGSLNTSTKEYTAPNTSCSSPDGCRDTIIYRYNISGEDGSTCKMEFEQVINLSDWYYLNLKVLLEGPYDKRTGVLNSLQFVLPQNTSGKYESPYNTLETVAVLPAQPISDWIIISLRDANDLSQDVTSVSAFLLTDGTICDVEGNSYVRFKNLIKSSYYVVVSHRNHVMIRSDQQYTLSTSPTAATVLDLTKKENVYLNNVISLGNGLFGMYAGDCDQNSLVNVKDLNDEVIKKMGISAGYHAGDVDFNMLINNLDKNVVRQNNGVSASIY